MANESQPTRFSAKRAAANSQKESLSRLESGCVEIPDQNLALLVAILGDRLDQIAAQVFERGEIGDLPWPEFLRQDELSPRPQPAREMVPLAVVRDALRRNFAKPGFEFVQIPRPRYLAAIGQTERKVAEAKLLGEETPQIAQ